MERTALGIQRNVRLALAAVLAPAILGMAQSRPSLPFCQGERLVYNAHAGPGLNGRAEMWIDAAVPVSGSRVFVLNSEIKGGFGPIKITDRTTSWLDPDRMATLRFLKDERSPMGHHTEDVEINAESRTWRSADSRAGVSPSDQPLDELSFIYMLRTLTLADDSALTLNRHFDPERNPTLVRSMGSGTVRTPAGTFTTREIEMRVHDTRRYKGEGVIRISLTDDACRRPVRIESRIPGAGKVVLELLSAEPRIPDCQNGDDRGSSAR